MREISVKEVLDLKYLNNYCFSPDARRICYVVNDGGVSDAYVLELASGKKTKITQAKSGVSGIEWTIYGLILVMDGDVYCYEDETLKRISANGKVRSSFAVNGDGLLAYSDGEKIFFQNLFDGGVSVIRGLGEVFAGRFSQTVHQDSFSFSPNGELLLYTFLDVEKRPHLALVDVKNQVQHIWMSDGHDRQISEGQWVNNTTIIYRLAGRFNADIEYFLGHIPPREEWKDYSHIRVVSKFSLERESIARFVVEGERGTFYVNVTCNPKREELIFGHEDDGFYHLYRYSLKKRTMKQFTFGQCEDLGQVGDKAVVSPDGRYIIYSSNKGHRIERQLYEYDLEKEMERQLTFAQVTNLAPRYSANGKTIIFKHSGAKEAADLWVMDLTELKPRQLTNVAPRELTEKVNPTELVTYKGAENWDIDAFVYKPKDFDPKKKYPAIVYVHGGPMRQMRGSFHPSSTYSLFYAFNQLLVSRGYIVISPNFRGGIGYGREFRYGLYRRRGVDDTKDIIGAAEYLKSQPYVDPERMAVYGLSYGGYMTLHSMTQYPDVFACGINIAGLWDNAQWGNWIRDTYGNYRGDANFCGTPEESPELWSAGSAVTYKAGLKRPLMSLHGTEDPNVDFNQLSRLVTDAVELGLDHEGIYYPGEMHTFRYRKTWEDAMPRMLAFFDKHLKEE